jgi:hypothetical protein
VWRFAAQTSRTYKNPVDQHVEIIFELLVLFAEFLCQATVSTMLHNPVCCGAYLEVAASRPRLSCRPYPSSAPSSPRHLRPSPFPCPAASPLLRERCWTPTEHPPSQASWITKLEERRGSAAVGVWVGCGCSQAGSKGQKLGGRDGDGSRRGGGWSGGCVDGGVDEARGEDADGRSSKQRRRLDVAVRPPRARLSPQGRLSSPQKSPGIYPKLFL